MPVWLALIDPISKLLDRIIPDPEQKAKAILELKKEENSIYLQELQLTAQGDANQTEVNKIEAASSSLFVSGWRPWLGWVCGTAFAYHFVIQPMLAFILLTMGYKVILPAFDMDTLSTVLMGMLGLGAMRSYDKKQGTSQ